MALSPSVAENHPSTQPSLLAGGETDPIIEGFTSSEGGAHGKSKTCLASESPKPMHMAEDSCPQSCLPVVPEHPCGDRGQPQALNISPHASPP